MSVNPTDMVRIILYSPTSTKGRQQMHTHISYSTLVYTLNSQNLHNSVIIYAQ